MPRNREPAGSDVELERRASSIRGAVGRVEHHWLVRACGFWRCVGALVVGVVLVTAVCEAPDSEVVSPPAESNTTDAPGSTPVTTVAAASESPGAGLWVVVEIVDGDTLLVDGPDGAASVRLIGINTPEVGECFYEQATDGLRALTGVEGVRLVRDVSEIDQYGRLLRFVESPDGVDIGAALVEAGLAVSRRYEPDTARNDTYDRLQADAQADGRGIWAADACGAPVESGVSITVEINEDAPGDDNENLNGEWVRFTNTGSADLDLTGWQVADESSSHRYTFATLTLAPAASVTLYTGCGSDTAAERYWCNIGSAVWNNSGDTVFLRDPNGNTILSETYRD